MLDMLGIVVSSESLQSYLEMSSPFSSFRATALRALGFDGFFVDSLDDHADVFAFMLPKSLFETHTHHDLITYLLHLFEQSGWKSLETKVLETAHYETNWCGSRHQTHILGPHILFRMEYTGHQQSAINHWSELSKPDFPCNWSIVEVEYDRLKPEGSCIRFSTSLYEAATPEQYMDVYNSLKQTAITEINNTMGRGKV